MGEIRCENERYSKYFKYKDVTYTEKTVVRFAQSYLSTHMYDNQPIWRYGYFTNRTEIDGTIYYVFNKCKLDPWNESSRCAGWCLIKPEDLDNAIEEIIEARPINIRPMIKQKDWEVPEVMLGWVIYVLVLLFSLILTQFYIVWFWASIFWFFIRKQLLLK